jgi:uncharacterized membrane protein YkoI
MISFDQWEKECLQHVRNDIIEWYLENENRQPKEREIEQGIQDRSEREYERMCGY